ncbi:hypothetical protein BpHYR1_048463 [Brachionus plicatilis]|uniref:Uncharacterized protein n=1 Tax=Brachionus plicatilis TaxID=10195 RepID=A0A3M7PSH1_BRAPC|nr:hypothetical protein BpHYR1_048463 [Brachionus plicatilis]
MSIKPDLIIIFDFHLNVHIFLFMLNEKRLPNDKKKGNVSVKKYNFSKILSSVFVAFFYSSSFTLFPARTSFATGIGLQG